MTAPTPRRYTAEEMLAKADQFALSGLFNDTVAMLRQAAAEGQGKWEARWQALKRELKHRYDTEHIPARKAEQDSILAEMYAAELPQPDAKCDCDGGCWSAQGCYRHLSATPTEPPPPNEVVK